MRYYFYICFDFTLKVQGTENISRSFFEKLTVGVGSPRSTCFVSLTVLPLQFVIRYVESWNVISFSKFATVKRLYCA